MLAGVSEYVRLGTGIFVLLFVTWSIQTFTEPLPVLGIPTWIVPTIFGAIAVLLAYGFKPGGGGRRE